MTGLRFCVVARSRDDERAQVHARYAGVAAVAAGMTLLAQGVSVSVYSNRGASIFQHAAGGQSLAVGTVYGDRLTCKIETSPIPANPGVNAEAAARELRDTIWGSYVAVISTPDGSALFVDPSGGLPFDMVTADDVSIATNDLTPAMCLAIGHKPRIDWPSLATTLVSPATAVHLPHLLGVRPAIPGYLHYLDKAHTDVPIWKPPEIARRANADDAALREAVDRSTAAMASDRSALQLSGGLDSSIVLSSIAAAGCRPTAITFATQAVGGDERDYAGLAAARWGVPMTTCAVDHLPSYGRLFREAPGAHPFIYGLDDVFEDTVMTAAASAGCDQILTGQGGDAVFFQPATPLVAVDRARVLGLGPRALAPMFDDARRSRSSIWHHLVPALADRFRKARVPHAHLGIDLLTPKTRAMVAATTAPHPWLADVTDLPPGKVMHLTMLANSQIFHARRPREDLAVRHPLLAQPVLEAALGIPTYRLACGTNDRGLARNVFADRLPPEIVNRRTKGDAADHYSRAALANLPFLREMLLDGVLVREGLVDRQALARLLTRERLFYSLDYRALVMHASCEAWARYWDAA